MKKVSVSDVDKWTGTGTFGHVDKCMENSSLFSTPFLDNNLKICSEIEQEHIKLNKKKLHENKVISSSLFALKTEKSM